MPSAFPPGDPAPADGSLPASALEGMPSRTFSVYVHVPFCRVRCGYCDFNTYTPGELGAGSAGGPTEGASLDTYATAAVRELDLARSVLGDRGPVVDTVFVGGGTPTLLAAPNVVRLLDAIPGVTCPEPEGAFYCYPSVKGLLGKALRGRTPSTSAELAELVLEEAGVAVVPGEAFGTPGYFRLSYALGDADLEKGVTRMAELLAEAR